MDDATITEGTLGTGVSTIGRLRLVSKLLAWIECYVRIATYGRWVTGTNVVRIPGLRVLQQWDRHKHR